MTYAIVETGGKQLWAEPGRFYDVEKLDVEADELVELSNVLLVQNDGDVSVGQPYVSGAVVKARVMFQRRGPKVIVYKMKPKKKTRRKKGHRQSLTRLMIESIELNGKVLGNNGAATTSEATEPIVAEVVEGDET
ncbi:MAG: 50S ribosomal protein L21 [Cyanobacteria bacterium J06642_2]